jgi:hypothetical protein
MKVSELLVKSTPQRVPKGRNLAELSWADGYLLVRFQLRGQLYIFGPSIPEVEFDKLMRSPFPDSLFQKNIKSKFKSYKVPSAN